MNSTATSRRRKQKAKPVQEKAELGDVVRVDWVDASGSAAWAHKEAALARSTVPIVSFGCLIKADEDVYVLASSAELEDGLLSQIQAIPAKCVKSATPIYKNVLSPDFWS